MLMYIAIVQWLKHWAGNRDNLSLCPGLGGPTL